MPTVHHTRRPVDWSQLLVRIAVPLLVTACVGPTTPLPPTATTVTTQAGPTPPPTALPAATSTAVPDEDFDGALDAADTCANQSNPSQVDLDGDGLGDACDSDLDGDDLPNSADACPFTGSADCAGDDPQTIAILNPAMLADPATAGLAYVQLTTFASGDSKLPDLLNGVLVPAPGATLFSSEGVLRFRMAFTLTQPVPLTVFAARPARALVRPVAWQAEPSVAGGSLVFVCQEAECSGESHYLLECGGEICPNPPPCPPQNARCAAAVDAAFGWPFDSLWAACEAASGECRFAAPLPAAPGDTFDTDYDFIFELPNTPPRAFEGIYSPPDDLPDFVPSVSMDPRQDCLPLLGTAPCSPSADLTQVALAASPAGAGYEALVTLETAEPLATDGSTTLGVPIGLLLPNGLVINTYQFGPGTAGGWPAKGFTQPFGGASTPLNELPAGLGITVEGNQAMVRVPLSPETAYVGNVFSVQTAQGALNYDLFGNLPGAPLDEPPGPLALVLQAPGAPPQLGLRLDPIFPDPGPYRPGVRLMATFPISGSVLTEEDVPRVASCGFVQAAALPDSFFWWTVDPCATTDFANLAGDTLYSPVLLPDLVADPPPAAEKPEPQAIHEIAPKTGMDLALTIESVEQGEREQVDVPASHENNAFSFTGRRITVVVKVTNNGTEIASPFVRVTPHGPGFYRSRLQEFRPELFGITLDCPGVASITHDTNFDSLSRSFYLRDFKLAPGESVICRVTSYLTIAGPRQFRVDTHGGTGDTLAEDWSDNSEVLVLDIK